MLGASFLPARFRNDHGHGSTSNPGYLSRKITPLLQSVSGRAFNHPIRTIVFVALLASTSYVGLLEGSLFDGAGLALGGTDFNTLIESGKRVQLGPETAWKWQMEDEESNITAIQNLVLATLVFRDSRSERFQRAAPTVNHIPIGKTKSVRAVSATRDSISSTSQDTSLAFSIPFDQAFDFLDSVQELPTAGELSSNVPEDVQRTASWVMIPARNGNKSQQNTLRWWAFNAWTNFVDLVKVCLVPINKFIGSQRVTARRTSRHYYHDSRLSVHASHLRLAVLVHAAHGIQLLAGNDSFDIILVCISVWYRCNLKARRCDKFDFTIRRAAIPGRDHWF